MLNPTPPVLLTVWRRPDSTHRALEAIRAARPKRLFIASDGPRNEEERALVAETRRLVATGIDWDCEIETLHRERNLGCRLAMAGAIDWFFDHVPAGIILEDDCVPHPDFFPYCAELLERYRDDDRVMHIGGDNSTDLTWDGDDSYRFVRWPQVWGWATWRRAWHHYDRDLAAWTRATAGRSARSILPDPVDREAWMPTLARLRDRGEPDTWDYQWTATIVRLGGLATVPRINLVSNIGFGPGATHTQDPDHPRADRPMGPVLPLRHPDEIRLDAVTDRLLLERTGERPRAMRRLRKRRSLRARTRRLLGPLRRRLGRLRRAVRRRGQRRPLSP